MFAYGKFKSPVWQIILFVGGCSKIKEQSTQDLRSERNSNPFKSILKTFLLRLAFTCILLYVIFIHNLFPI